MSELVKAVVAYQLLSCLIPLVVIVVLVGVYFLLEWLNKRR